MINYNKYVGSGFFIIKRVSLDLLQKINVLLTFNVVFLNFQQLAEQKIRKQERTIKELQATVNEQSARLSSNEAVVNDLKRQVDELKNCLTQQCPSLESNPNGIYIFDDLLSLSKNFAVLF